MTKGLPYGTRLKILRIVCANEEISAAQILAQDHSMKRGTLYTSLKRLEADGLVLSRVDAVSTIAGRPVRWYRVTARSRCLLELLAHDTAVMTTLEPP